MANEFFDPGETRAQKVSQLFAAIARRYDLVNDVQSLGLHRFWKKQLIQLARLRTGENALDLCCGTGDLAFALAQKGAAVTGLDFSEAMLTVARERARQSPPRASHRTPIFIRGDAQRIPFPDASFDVVTIGYGLRNLSDWVLGLEEMYRVAKPGARILSLDFGKPDNALWRKVYFAYLRTAVPLLGQIFCKNAGAYAYILESLNHFPAQHGIAAKMKALRLENVTVHSFSGGVMSINYGEKAGA